MSHRLIRYISCLLLCCISLYSSVAQDSIAPAPWWNTNQQYKVIKIDQDGIYKLSKEVMLQNGIPVDQLSSDHIRLYNRGQEVMLYSTTHGIMNDEDYVLFHGVPNDGTLDKPLYTDPSDQLNPYYSLSSDINTYYLTWTPDQVSSARYTHLPNGYDNAITEEKYYIHHEQKVYHEHHQKPVYNGRDFIRYSDYGPGEGFGAAPTNETILKIPVQSPSPIGPPPLIKLRFGTNVYSVAWQITVNGILLDNVYQNSYGTVEINERLPIDITTTDTIEVKISSTNNANEKHILAYYDINYPRLYPSVTKSYWRYQEQPSILSRRISLSNKHIANPLVLNTTKGTSTTPVIQGDRLNYAMPYSYTRDDIHIFDTDSGVSSIETMDSYNFKAVKDTGSYLILTHPSLMSAAKEYAAYRASAHGGGYKVDIVSVTDLAHHYSYGVEHHPLSIKAYLDNRVVKPQYVFIIGKGIEYKDIRQKGLSSLVPTFGMPGSDQLLLTTNGTQKISSGRLAAQNIDDVKDYLAKIKEHESPTTQEQTIEHQSWKKNILHLSGGSSDIQNLLFGYLNNMSDVLAHNTFGGRTQTFRKTSADPIQTARSEEIISAIDHGSAWLSFFGHSAVGTFDFSLEDPKKYSNKGRNPIILSMGCYSGNLHTAHVGISESFVLTPDVGATHFMASSGTAYINPQYHMGMLLYELMGDQMYGAPIGDIVREAISQQQGSNDIAVQTLLQQWTLHGDPAYRTKVFDGPDYVVDDATMSISPSLINSTTDEFELNLDIKNLGRYQKTALDIQVIHTYGDGSTRDTIVITMPAPANSERINIDLPNPGAHAAGLNEIEINVDPQNAIKELPEVHAEQNNSLSEKYTFYILDNSATPTYPQDFGIVTSNEQLELRASLNNAFSFGGLFAVQIDTTEMFDSPLLETQQIRAASSQIKWQPNILLNDEQVYYWRIAPIEEHINDQKYRWQGRSFVYLQDGENGYNQSHYYQWKKDKLDKTELDSATRKWTFDERKWDIRIKNKLNDPNDFWVFVNNSPWKSLNPKNLSPGVQIFAWHKDQVIVANNGRDYGSRPYSKDGFVFKTDTPQQRKGIIDLLHALPDGAQVFFHTLIEDDQTDLKISEWQNDKALFGESLIDVLRMYGAQRIDELLQRGTVPYTFIFTKGGNQTVEDIGERITETIDLSSIATTLWHEGSILSTPISNVNRYLRLQWAETKDNTDKTQLIVHGISPNGRREILKTIEGDYDVNLTGISPEKYPQIQLEYKINDPDRTAPQLQYWRVQYSPLSDAILLATEAHTTLKSDSIHAGEDIEIRYSIENQGPSKFQPMLVRYKFINADGEKVVAKRIARSIPANETIDVVERISSDGMGGTYTVVVELNPNQEQQELNLTNNFGQQELYVIPDRRNPFLDVTVDGRHVTEQYVSDGRPEIIISLSDPGSPVLLDNPDDVEIRLLYPEFLQRRVTADAADVVYLPATSSERNTARYIFTPKLDIKGVYTLEVNASDKAGNKAGEYSYKTKFSVADEVEETQISISPNPFVATTKIKYRYKGKTLPKVFYINIYSADGLLVKHISNSDLGGLFYGNNEYIWDGTNDAGAILPNGIYYYQVVNSNDDSSKKKRGGIIKMR